MQVLKAPLLLLALVLLAGAPHLAHAKPLANVVLESGTRMEWADCWFDAPFTKKVHCGYLYPSHGSVRGTVNEVRLPVVVIGKRFSRHKNDPVLYLEGGPGYSTGLDEAGMERWWAWLDQHGWPHDLILFDQRGTGLGAPDLDCPNMLKVARASLPNALDARQEGALWREATGVCRRYLEEQGIDVSAYTTQNITRDIYELMEALARSQLGYERFNLYAASYGTRLGLSLLRTRPQRVRAVILDSVYPPDKDALLEGPYLADNALYLVVEGCAADAACRARYGDLEARL
ncbi:MAG: alpha/beta fold hydrolase, partial [Pseudomonadota bacterium]